MTAVSLLCCILYGTAGYCDERERKIPRILSVLAFCVALCCWCIQFYQYRVFSLGNLLVSTAYIGIAVFFCFKNQMGLGDVLMLPSMLLFLNHGQPVMELLWQANLLFCIAFFSAAIRIFLQRLIRRDRTLKSCPFALHLLAGFLVAMYL